MPTSAHATNRYELKYFVTPAVATALRAEFAERLDGDAMGIDGAYEVWSRYYDTPSLDFYWEKIDGEKFRRKLRIRHYGPPHTLSASTPVFVEIKQRINRTTQKRRACLTYRDAELLCAGKEPSAFDGADSTFIEEVRRLVGERHLLPIAVVAYSRQAFVGRAPESGLRITIDSHLRGRDRDLDLSLEGQEHRLLIEPMISVLEIKVNDRAPYWLSELAARHRLQLERVSKYCLCIDAYGRRPRSMFHASDHEELICQ